MVGCHSSLVRTYLYELLAAVEHCHRHGVVHRDLKCENVLLGERKGHCVLIDFGTAKDLVETDLNGPEFVGTPGTTFYFRLGLVRSQCHQRPPV